MPMFTVGLDPVSCCLSPPPPQSSLSGSVRFSDAPINPETCATWGRAGRYLARTGAPRCTPSRCPSSPELSKYRHTDMFFIPRPLLFIVTLEGAAGRRKSHLCTDLPALSAPPCTEVRPFRGRWRFSGPRTLKNKTEGNAGWSWWSCIHCFVKKDKKITTSWKQLNLRNDSSVSWDLQRPSRQWINLLYFSPTWCLACI